MESFSIGDPGTMQTLKAKTLPGIRMPRHVVDMGRVPYNNRRPGIPTCQFRYLLSLSVSQIPKLRSLALRTTASPAGKYKVSLCWCSCPWAADSVFAGNELDLLQTNSPRW